MLINKGVLTDIDIVGLFKKGELCVSEANMVLGMPCGVIFDLKSKKKYYEIYKNNIKNSIDGEPYFIMAQNTSYGLLLSVLYVSKYTQEWQMDGDSLNSGNPLAYIYNVDEDFGEVGYIRFDIFNGGPIRTA